MKETGDAPPVRVVFAADELYAIPLTVAIRSLLDHTPMRRGLEIYVLDGGIDETSKRVVLESCEGLPRFLSPLPRPLPSVDGALITHITPTTYLRLQLPELLPADKVIYLDSDLLVLDDIAELWALAPDGPPLAGVLDAFLPKGFPALERLGFGSRGLYFNAGVLVMDLGEMRRSGALTEAAALAGRVQLPFADQDVLNVMFEKTWHQLPPRWNIQVNRMFNLLGRNTPRFQLDPHPQRALDEVMARPGIVHFLGEEKPWHIDGGRLRYADVWRAVAARTGWRDGLDEYGERMTLHRMRANLGATMRALKEGPQPFDEPTFLARLYEALQR